VSNGGGGVGVVLNLAAWFALHTVFGDVGTVALGPATVLVPRPATLDWRALLIAAAAVVAMFSVKVGMLPTLGGAALAGAVLHVVT
jgi:chromate transporter